MSSPFQDKFAELLQRCDFHRVRAGRQCKFNHILSHTLNLAIPLLAAWTTFLTAEDLGFRKEVIIISGFLLTVLTILNSTLKPGEKFANLAEICIQLYDWKYKTELRWENLDHKKEDVVEKFLIEQNAKLTEVGQKFAQQSQPERK